jgi:hypothetical protein
MIRFCEIELIRLPDGPLAPLAQQARAAIVMRDTARLRDLAIAIRESASDKRSVEATAAACLVFAGDLIDRGSDANPTREAH